jgi:hypothetical protein
MPDHPPREEYLYCRVALEDGQHALQAQAMTEDEAAEANLDLIADEPEWARVSRADDDYFAAFYAAPLTTIAAEALARAIGVGAAPVETLAALEARYFPIFRAMIRSAHAIGRQVRLDMGEA